MAEGARNRQSAVNKVYREIAVETVGKKDVTAFFLQDYERKRGGLSVYLQTEKQETVRVSVLPETPPPKSPLQIGQAVKLTNCTVKRNIFTGVEWMETAKETTVAPVKVDKNFWYIGCYKLPEDGGIAMVSGRVLGVWPVTKFEPDGTRGEEYPILDKGGAVNLRLSIEPSLDEGMHGAADVPGRMSVKIPDVARLKLLVGDDIEWLDEDGAILELADMLKNQPVVVFGSVKAVIGKGRKNEKEVGPYFDIRNFGFVIMSPEDAEKVAPSKGPSATGGWGSSKVPGSGEKSGEGKESEGESSDESGDDIYLGEDDDKGK